MNKLRNFFLIILGLLIGVVIVFLILKSEKVNNEFEGYYKINDRKVVYFKDKALVSINNNKLIQSEWNYYVKDNLIYYSEQKIDTKNLKDYNYFKYSYKDNKIYIMDIFNTTLTEITKSEYLRITQAE